MASTSMRPPRVRVERAARAVVVVLVEHDLLHPDAQVARVGAAAQRQLIAGANETTDIDQRARLQPDVRAGATRDDRAAQQQIAIGDEVDPLLGLAAPGAATGRIERDAAVVGHRETDARRSSPRLDPDRSGGVDLPPETSFHVAYDQVTLGPDVQRCRCSAHPGRSARIEDDAV